MTRQIFPFPLLPYIDCLLLRVSFDFCSLASRVVVASLCADAGDRSVDPFASFDLQREKELRLGALLDYDGEVKREVR